LDATTSDSVWPCITSPWRTGAVYVAPCIHARLAGSMDSRSVRHSTSPSPGSGTGSWRGRKWRSPSAPSGSSSTMIWRLVPAMVATRGMLRTTPTLRAMRVGNADDGEP
jgi:hypothetical protein